MGSAPSTRGEDAGLHCLLCGFGAHANGVGEGDAEAYRELVRRHAERLHHFAFRLLRSNADAEDVVQDTFLQLWLHASEYVPTARVAAWLHRIAHNLAMDRLRSRKHLGEFNDDFELSRSNSASQPELLEAKRDAETLYRALDTLPVRQAAALVLVYLNGLSRQGSKRGLVRCRHPTRGANWQMNLGRVIDERKISWPS